MEPASTPEPVVSSLPELSEKQGEIFLNNITGLFNGALGDADLLDAQSVDYLTGPFLAVLQVMPNYVEYMNNITEDFDQKIQPLTDRVDSLSQEEKNAYLLQAIKDYNLGPDAPTQLQISYGVSLAEYDPATGTSDLSITIPQPTDLSYLNDGKTPLPSTPLP